MNLQPKTARLPGLRAILTANMLLRGAMTASGSNALIGFYLASLALQGRNIDAAIVGFLESAFHIAALLIAIPFGILIDRYSPRLVIVVAAVIGAVATQLFGISGLIGIFFLSRVLEGIASAGGNSGMLAHLTDITAPTPTLRGRVMSGFEISLFAGVALGSLLSGPLWESLGTRAFSLLSSCYILAAILFNWGARGQPLHNPTTEAPLEGLKTALRDRFLRRLGPAWLAYNTVTGIWLSQTVFQLSGAKREGQYLVGLFANNARLVGLILFAFTILTAIGIFMWGRILTRQPRVRVMRFAISGMYVSSFFFFLINSSTDWSPTVRLVAILGYVGSVIMQSGFTPAALALLADIAEKSSGKGASMGIYTLLLSLGNIIGASFGGVLAQWQAFNGMIVATLLFASIAMVALFLLSSE